MNILIVNNSTIHLHEIHTLFPKDTNFTYISYHQIGGIDTEKFDCLVLTGSSSHTYAYKAFDKEVEVVQKSTKPIIGICLGCELIASAFGGVVEKQITRIEGDIEITCYGDSKEHTVHEAHRYAIIDLGKELIALAHSFSGYEIITHKTKPIIGFQFHPEVRATSNDGYNLFMEYFPLLKLGKI